MASLVIAAVGGSTLQTKDSGEKLFSVVDVGTLVIASIHVVRNGTTTALLVGTAKSQVRRALNAVGVVAIAVASRSVVGAVGKRLIIRLVQQCIGTTKQAKGKSCNNG